MAHHHQCILNLSRKWMWLTSKAILHMTPQKHVLWIECHLHLGKDYRTALSAWLYLIIVIDLVRIAWVSQCQRQIRKLFETKDQLPALCSCCHLYYSAIMNLSLSQCVDLVRFQRVEVTAEKPNWVQDALHHYQSISEFSGGDKKSSRFLTYLIGYALQHVSGGQNCNCTITTCVSNGRVRKNNLRQ